MPTIACGKLHLSLDFVKLICSFPWVYDSHLTHCAGEYESFVLWYYQIHWLVVITW